MNSDRMRAPATRVLTTEVCVVGAGPAGLVLADSLSRQGHSVLLVEAGPGEPPVGGAPIDTADSVGVPYPVTSSRASGVGGSSLHWDIVTPVGQPYVRLRELDALDFSSRPGVTDSGWPISKEDLSSAYHGAWALFGLERSAEEDAPEAAGVEGLVTKQFSFGPAAALSHDLPAALRWRRVQMLPATSVVEVVLAAAGGEVEMLRCRTEDGSSIEVAARAYVLAAGGIENPRILLASAGATGRGVGNEHDLVGRFFMEHLHVSVGVLVPHDDRLLEDTSAWRIHAQGRRAVERRYGLPEAVVRREGLLGAAFKVVPRSALRPLPLLPDGSVAGGTLTAKAGLQDAVRARRPLDALRHVPPLAAALPRYLRYVQRQGGRPDGRRAGGRPPLFRVIGMTEQRPNPDSRVRLSEALGGLGLPRAVLDLRVTDDDLVSLRTSLRLVAGPLGQRLGGRVQSLLDVSRHEVGWGWHHLGTTRMAADARAGVVDPDCRVHSVRNLWVAGSSVFPTGGFANPTLTLLALSIRLADHLHRVLRPATIASTEPGEAGP